MPSRTIRRLAAAVAPVALGAALAFAPAANADTTCTKFASTEGSNSAAGSVDAPFRTAQQLADSLSAGDTGCLRGGTYIEDLTMRIPGHEGAPVTITSYPGERAKLIGRLWIPRTGDYVTISNLDLNGSPKYGANDDNDPSPTINANNATFTGNDVTNDHTAICFLVGSSWGHAANAVIDGNRIHDCGKLPAANHEHGIYVEDSSDVEIVNNAIFDNADRGVQLYPSAQRTHVAHNVIDGNGEGILFSGDDGFSSNDNVVEDNIITNANQRNNIESWYPDGNPVGTGNVVRDNCIGGGGRDNGNGGISEEWGFKVADNNVVGKNPRFLDRTAKDFRLDSDSPCGGFANGATHSAGTRAQTTEPTAPTPTSDTPTRDSSPRVSVTTSKARNGVLRMKGRVHRGLDLQNAGSTTTKAVIQIRWDGSWYPLKSLRVVNGHFKSRIRVPANLRGKVITLRVVVPAVAKSRAVRVRAGR